MVLDSGRRKNATSEKRKTSLADFVAEMQREEAEEEARLEKQEAEARRMTSRQLAEADKKQKEAGNMSFERMLRADQIQPLVDLAYSESMLVARSAVGLLATLSMNSDNKDILISAGCLKPLLAKCAPDTEFLLRRNALQGLANMSSREDIRARLCAVPGGLKALVEGVRSRDLLSRLAAAEAVANIASSIKLRGRLVQEGVLPAVAELLNTRHPELKRWSMVTLQRLSTCTSRHGSVASTREDPEGDGYANEMLDQGVLVPMLQLLRGGPQVEEDLRTLAIQSIHEMCFANDDVKLRLCKEHFECLKVIVGLMLLDEYPGGATQREACRVVQVLAQTSANLSALLSAGVLAALAVLARAEAVGKKQIAATLLHRLASDSSENREMMLDAGGARTLCSLARATLPRKVVRPAVTALVGMCALPACVQPLLDSGCGYCLATLGTSSDPELRVDGCKALADMLCCDAPDPLRSADMLLMQGALGVFLGAAYSRDRATQLAASRGLLAFAERSPTHARIIARKGAARALAALVLGRDKALSNAVRALYEVTNSLTSADKASAEPEESSDKGGSIIGRSGLNKDGGGGGKLTKRRMSMVRGVLEVGVVGTAKELWARLNDDGGVPAAQLMRIARLNDGANGLGEMAQHILHELKPDVLQGVLQDMPEKTGYSPTAVAERAARQKCVAKIQKRFRELATLSADPKARAASGANLWGGGGGRSAFHNLVAGAQKQAAAKNTPRERAANAANLKALREAAADGGGIAASPAAAEAARTGKGGGGGGRGGGDWVAGSAAKAANATNAALNGGAYGAEESDGGAASDSPKPPARRQSSATEQRSAGIDLGKRPVGLDGYTGMSMRNYSVAPGSISAAMALPGSARDLVKALSTTPTKTAARRANQKATEANEPVPTPGKGGVAPRPPSGASRRPVSASPRGRR